MSAVKPFFNKLLIVVVITTYLCNKSWHELLSNIKKPKNHSQDIIYVGHTNGKISKGLRNCVPNLSIKLPTPLKEDSVRQIQIMQKTAIGGKWRSAIKVKLSRSN